jgi:hypothetical protein
MFEIGIFCVIILAVSYWTVLWLMGRREDMLHGEFVEGKSEPDEPVRATFPGPTDRPVFPKRPMFLERPAFPEPPVLSERPVLPERPLAPEPPVQAAVPEQPAFRPERLERLLASIKQDLNQLVQK